MKEDGNKMKHGFEETKTQKANGLIFIKRTKYCVIHGLIDVGYPEGERDWENLHALCGAGFPPVGGKRVELKKAA